MNTAILSQSGGNIGIGFAIPVDMVEAISKKLIASGRVSRGELGVRLQKLTPLLAKALEVADKGALVADVVPDSAAAKAGLEAGDVITKLDGAAVTDPNNLRLRIGEKSPGTAVRLTLRRDGQEKSVTATLTALQPETADASPPVTERHSAFLSGLDIGPISRADRAFGKVKGVYVERIEPMSTAALAGLQKGDVITAVNHRPVGAVRQFERDVLMRAKGQALLLNVRRDGSSMFIAIE
jgi:S1-C subfamily serine protease